MGVEEDTLPLGGEPEESFGEVRVRDEGGVVECLHREGLEVRERERVRELEKGGVRGGGGRRERERERERERPQWS